MEYIILSSNPSLGETVRGIKVLQVQGGLDEFYEALSSALQNNFRLLTSPIPPNIPLIRSPVRSVVLGRTERKYDAPGLLLLEQARERTETLGIKDGSRVRKDLEFIDRDHLLVALAQMAALAEMGDPEA